jgi:hypothetical protein
LIFGRSGGLGSEEGRRGAKTRYLPLSFSKMLKFLWQIERQWNNVNPCSLSVRLHKAASLWKTLWQLLSEGSIHGSQYLCKGVKKNLCPPTNFHTDVYSSLMYSYLNLEATKMYSLGVDFC